MNFHQKLLQPDVPFSPQKLPFFYGWVILVVSILGMLMSIPGQTIGVSVFTDYLIEHLGLSRVQLSMAYMFGTITSSFFLPWSGRLFDRLGARAMVVVSSVLLGAVLVFLSQCDRLAWILAFGQEGWLFFGMAFFLVYLGFFLLRFSGQGMLTLTSRSMLGKWFQKKRGLVSGINGFLVTGLFCLAPIGYNHLILATSWRWAWLISALAAFAMALVGWLFFRDSPEECGLRMDGAAAPTHSTEADKQSHQDDLREEEEAAFTVQEARRTYSFWIFNLGLAAYALIITAITFHIVSLGEQMGLNREEALTILIPMAYISIACNFVFSWISDRVPLKYLLMLLLAAMASSISGIPVFDHPFGQVKVIVGLGISGGFFGPLMTVVWPTFFGRRHLGAISSLNLSSCVFGSALGPFIFGWSFDVLGSYMPGLLLCFLMPISLFLFALKADPPRKRAIDPA